MLKNVSGSVGMVAAIVSVAAAAGAYSFFHQPVRNAQELQDAQAFAESGPPDCATAGRALAAAVTESTVSAANPTGLKLEKVWGLRELGFDPKRGIRSCSAMAVQESTVKGYKATAQEIIFELQDMRDGTVTTRWQWAQ